MKRVLILTMMVVFTLGCLLSPGLPSSLVQTEVAIQLTSLVTDTPTEMNLPAIATLVPPAIGLPTKKPGVLFFEQATATPIAYAPLPTKPPKPTKEPTTDPEALPPPEPVGKVFQYNVTGSAASAEIAIITPEGNFEVGTFTLPFKREYTFMPGAYLSLTARVLSTEGDVTCEIISNDEVLATNKASGTGQMATCVIELPE
ncbi:MAG: hypothetical protein GYA12_03130 [Chloroflexi bacterium]|nr:hypothetical protein [Chloroflexota bacterium]BCY19056.1 hypothetical protein hrd7_29050 [Leptolinea sp. HRD-7]